MMLRKRGAPAFIELLKNQPQTRWLGARAADAQAEAPGGADSPAPAKPLVQLRPIPAGSPPRAANPAAPPRWGVGVEPKGSVGGTATAPSTDPLPPPASPVPPSAGRAAIPTYNLDGSERPAHAAAPGSTEPSAPGQLLLPRAWLFLAAAIVIVVSIVWVIAYRSGEASGKRAGQEQLQRMVDGDAGTSSAHTSKPGVQDPLAQPSPQPAPPASDPLPPTNPGSPNTGASRPPTPPGGGASKPPGSPPARETGFTPGTSGGVTTFQPGLNYLVVATLRRTDADEAAKYLSSQGLGVLILPEKGVDPASSAANNGSWEVLVLRGYASPLSASQTERETLESQVKLLGRRWKAENKKAPTDFSQVFWKRFKGS